MVAFSAILQQESKDSSFKGHDTSGQMPWPSSKTKTKSNAFCEVKQRLEALPALGHLDRNDKTKMHTKAFNTKLGAVVLGRTVHTERMKTQKIYERLTYTVVSMKN